MGPKARKLTLPLNGLNPQDHSVPLSLSMVSVPPLAGVDVVADGLPHAPTSTASADSMPMIAYRRRLLIPNPPRLAHIVVVTPPPREPGVLVSAQIHAPAPLPGRSPPLPGGPRRRRAPTRRRAA